MTLPPDLAIVVCTHRRTDLLRRSLTSLAAQRCPPGVTVVVVVVDNSDDSSAAATVEAMRAACPFAILSLTAHPANISIARNVGVAATAAPAVAFVDDDEELDAGWLEAVVDGLARYPHDVLVGRVDAAFGVAERASEAVRRVFSRRLDAPPGTDLFATGRHKTRALALGTSNSIFRRATTLTDPRPFDPVFGGAGGEDFDLFCRLEVRGRRFGWLPTARAFELVPEDRCDIGYLTRRLYAAGQVFAAALAGNSRHPRLTRNWLRLKAAAQAGLMLLRRPLARSPEAQTDFALRWAGVMGKLSFGGFYHVYREADAPGTPAAGDPPT